MKQPEGYDDGTGRVCLLIKTLYGLKQSGREWNKELDMQLKEKGFKNLCSDPCAYIRRIGDELEIITVWVDDLLLFTGTDQTMIKLKAELQTMFELTDMGEPSKIVGIEINQHADYIAISQTKYIESILHKEGMENVNPVSTPLDPNVKLEPNPEAAESNRSNTYASLIGSLQYLATATRPDIAYAVNRLASYTANPTLTHYSAAKRVLRYQKITESNITRTRHKITHLEIQIFATDMPMLHLQMQMNTNQRQDMFSCQMVVQLRGDLENKQSLLYLQQRLNT